MTTPTSEPAPTTPTAPLTTQYRAYQPSHSSSHSSTPSPRPASPPLDPSNLPNGEKSLSGISLRAFILGTTLGLTTTLTLHLLVITQTPLWRLPFFLGSLSLFHFLEYYTTAAHNPRFATVSAFLLSSNGWAYNVAHGSALLECLITYTVFPHTTPRTYYLPWPAAAPAAASTPRWAPAPLTTEINPAILLGLVLMIVGQTTRSVAMAQAGSNFNHTVQVSRRDDHRLVTTGIYRVLRHPSYFGFFWWGIGTQLVLGNVACLVGYALVLWRFFRLRVRREENYLCAFFGDQYREYRKRSWVGIPFV
ncbi:protein-S-isoprenylcysteine carboxyl O-methyltransferase [Aspergillus homomorphus CBS 101889]|uniref:Protein-S-isoprenylcysteine O-methyltransferase n=1 Tax=Aspergillus homomorphus (strain CBS 101889) TaxID=1450537 RepID=A0A395I7Q5_ASPHC|nr:ICMT-domain-containing protein [Aspergillus homomorphus CBS 101889]RAL15098.1 ICMT-domain-containing protein [Aspergillus homomorphus CBS 101889]